MSNNKLPHNRLKYETEYLSCIKKYPDQVFMAHKDSVQEGFEYFASDEYLTQQEMDKEKIDLAPDLRAGEEVMKVYNTLGLAVNDIARWLRDKHDIRCQSNHPLGGLVNTINQTITCIDRIKCFPQFSKTLGCSICIKVCPFSKVMAATLK